jgi:PAT family acetyl-CoA transporter-like MFS transporter 1
LRFVDAFTAATCTPKPSLKSFDPFSCALQLDKERCDSLGGMCTITRDGYYMVNMVCVAVGVATFVLYIRPKVLQLQALPLRAWRLTPSSSRSRTASPRVAGVDEKRED